MKFIFFLLVVSLAGHTKRGGTTEDALANILRNAGEENGSLNNNPPSYGCFA